MPILNWVYGAKQPGLADAVDDAIYRAHRYRNKLCELELAKRDRHEDLLRRLAPEYVTACQAVEAVEAELAEHRQTIQRERTKQRTKQPKGSVVEAAREGAKACKLRLRELRGARKAAKHAAYEDPQVQAAMEDNQSQHKAAQRVAKEESGLYWGTEAVVKQACASFSSGAPPKFKRYNGEGQLAVQLQGGMDCREAYYEDTRVQLVVPNDLQEQLAQHGKAPKSMRKAECLIRIDSDPETRGPIFAHVPVIFHRPLPAGKVKWAFLERRKLANRDKWKVRLAIDLESHRKPTGEGMVAVHIGWRMDEQGLRVATVLDDAGKWRYLRLPLDHIDDFEEVYEIQSDRDRNFNEMRDALKDWLVDRDVPAWLREATSHMHQWRSPARLAKLVWEWCKNRFDSDDDIFERLEKWRKKDKKRWQHECRLRKRVIRRRADAYRCFASDLARKYSTVVIAPIEAKRLTEHSDPEDLERDVSARRAKQAAVSDLLRMVRERFPLCCVEVDAAGISQTCANCGAKNPHRRWKVQCSECHITYDVDETAATNMLARGEAAVTCGALLELEAAQEDRDRKQREKLAKMQAANRAARKRRREAVS